MKPGDKIKVKSGPFAGETVLLKRHVADVWYAWIGDELTMVYDNELEGRSGKKTKAHTEQPDPHRNAAVVAPQPRTRRGA